MKKKDKVMINKLFERYPNAHISSKPSNNSKLIWFYVEIDNQYIGIPLSELSEAEKELLKTLFPKYHEIQKLNTSEASKKWFEYLYGTGNDYPVNEPNAEYRIIQFSITQYKADFESEDWMEAIKALFPHEITIIFTSQNNGAIIEKKHNYLLTLDELYTSIHALESDFYFKIHFFIGQFKALTNELKSLFQFEQILYSFAKKEMGKDRVFTLEKVFPLYLLKNIPSQTRRIGFSTIYDIFQDDPELRRLIKLYLENQTNASLTAKQLFLHRNSLQYRIDKFTEKTGFDLKSFATSVIVYLACLDFEYFD